MLWTHRIHISLNLMGTINQSAEWMGDFRFLFVFFLLFLKIKIHFPSLGREYNNILSWI